MNTRFLTRSSAVILACLCSIVTTSYACTETPIAEIVTPWWRGACVGEVVCFDGEGTWGSEEGSWDPDNGPPYSGGHGIELYEWLVGSDCQVHVDTLYGPSPCHTFWDPGYYCLDLWVRDDEEDWCLSEDVDQCHVNVIEVDEVVKVGPEPEETGHVYTCIDGLLNLYAKPNIEFLWPDGTVTWQIASTDPPDLTATLTPHDYKYAWAYLSDFSGPGDYVIEATWGPYDPGDNTITVTAVAVELLSADATDPLNTKINYQTDPLDGTISSPVMFSAPGTTDSKPSVSGMFYFTYSQADIASYGWHEIRLNYCTRTLYCSVTKKEKNPDAQEILSAYFMVEGVGLRLYTHTLRETYDPHVYSIPYSGKTIHTMSSTVLIDFREDYGNICGWTERHKYSWSGGGSAWVNMAPVTGLLPPNTDGRYCQTVIWCIPTALEGIADCTGLLWDYGGGTAPALLTNSEVDCPMPE